MISLKEVWDSGNLSFQPTELSHWETVWGWLLPLPLGNGKTNTESQDKEWGAEFTYCISILIGIGLQYAGGTFWSMHSYTFSDNVLI